MHRKRVYCVNTRKRNTEDKDDAAVAHGQFALPGTALHGNLAPVTNPSFDLSLVGEICGSPIRSNGRGKLGSRSPRARCGIARLQLFLFVASCLSTSLPSTVNATRQRIWTR